MSLYPLIFLLGCFLCVTAHPGTNFGQKPYVPRPTHGPTTPKIFRPPYNRNSPVFRVRRFVAGGAGLDGQKPPEPEQKRPEWEIKPDLSRDQQGNTKGRVEIEKHGEDHDFNAGWGQTIRGPNKHSETWHVGGSIRW